MIARRRLAHPSWHLTVPDWALRFRWTAFASPRRSAVRDGAERAALEAARERRASALRIDAERRFSGVGPR